MTLKAKDMPTTIKALLQADPKASIGVALAQSYFTSEGLSSDDIVDVTPFNIDYLEEAKKIQSTKNLADGMIGFDPICTDEGLNAAFEEESESESESEEDEGPKPRRLVPGQNFTVISKKYVDPECDISNPDKYHIYEEGDLLYNIVLNQTDIKNNSNSYYTMQLLAPDSGKGTWYVWFKWGRVGTNIGSQKLGQYQNLLRAKKEFMDKFYAKSRNRWPEYAANRFVKYGGAYFPIEIHYEDDDEKKDENMERKPSKLSPEVQELINLIFDTSTLKKAMSDMQLDMEKMPLGKLSKNTIQLGFSTLTEIESELNNRKGVNKQKLLSLSNKFYTVIPHNFQKKSTPPVIDNVELLRQKLDMLQTLTDIEIASRLMKEKKKGKLHPIDCNYLSLKNQIQVLEKDHPNYELVQQYLKDAHSHRHKHFKLNLKNIFTLKRQGEEEKFSRYDLLENHMLLWHGSRLSNWAGILSQGLRIAPPEAPHSGYKFGKGVYHANMASMSAEYCFPENFNNQMLLMISEVALGQQYIQETPKYITKEDITAFGKQSVLALGQWSLDSTRETSEHGSSAVFPLGTEAHTGYDSCPQDHPEFVVYDTSQVKMRYLLQIEFQRV